MPRVHNGMQVYSPAEYFDVRTYGTSNDQIILIEGVEPVLYGRFPAGGKSWNDVEQWVARSFSTPYSILNATNQNPNRHIDYQRFFFVGDTLCTQSIEVKKTTGNCLAPPTYLRSSPAQLKAMFEHEHLSERNSQVLPSIYVVVSYDYCHNHKLWIFTVWVIPCINSKHFRCFDTKGFHIENRPYPVTNKLGLK